MSGVRGVGIARLIAVTALAAFAGASAFAQPVATDPVLAAPAPRAAWPAGSQALNEQGKADLSLCVNDIGQVTAVRLIRSTGYPRLDTASLDWAKTLKFRPAMRSGMPTPVCGHRMSYEWSQPG